MTSISRLLSLILPFTAGALLHALEGFCRQPHLPAIALVGLALLQASAISAGEYACSNHGTLFASIRMQQLTLPIPKHKHSKGA